MIITAPVTDYIPASVLTTQGDILRRGITVPERLEKGGVIAQLVSTPTGGTPVWNSLEALVSKYYKGGGVGAIASFQDVALRDTGIEIGQSSRGTSGDEVISGLSFEPSIAFFLAVDGAGTVINWSSGFDDGTTHHSIVLEQNGGRLTLQNSHSIYIFLDNDNWIRGLISAKDSTSVTITWTILGARTALYIYLFLP